MPEASDALRRFDAVAQVGLRLARSAPSGRVLLAQLALGIDERWIPRPWGEDLLAAMDQASEATAEPLGRARLHRTLEGAWEAKCGEVLDDLDPEPIAVTPTSQVHRATLEGESVAIKVQHPGLARSVRQDLALLDSLAAPLHGAFPALDARALLREIGERTRDELDLEHEAAGARRLRRALRAHPGLVVPAPVARLTTEAVLVREWIDGDPVDTATTAPATRDATARALVEFALGGARRGIMNAGLTPADVLVCSDGRTAIVDHSVCCEVDRARLPATIAAVRALIADAPDTFAEALATLGWLDAKRAPAALAALREILGELLGPGPVRLDPEAVRDCGLRLAAQRDTVAGLLGAGAVADVDLWPLRGVAQLFSTIARIGATADFAALSLTALTEGWDGAD